MRNAIFYTNSSNQIVIVSDEGHYYYIYDHRIYTLSYYTEFQKYNEFKARRKNESLVSCTFFNSSLNNDGNQLVSISTKYIYRYIPATIIDKNCTF